MSAIQNDWRYQGAALLKGQSFVWKPYGAYREGWDHDHCAGCMATFSNAPGVDSLHEGWAVTSDYPKGADYEWLCADCFELLKESLSLTPR